MSKRLSRNSLVLASDGGGEILIGKTPYYVPAGTHNPGQYLALSGGEPVRPGKGVVFIDKPSQARDLESVQPFGSAANPNFKISNAVRLNRELERKMHSLEALTRRQEAAAAAFVRGRSEPEPEPEPEPAPQPAPVEPAPAKV